mgnify:CR=1 FL=1
MEFIDKIITDVKSCIESIPEENQEFIEIEARLGIFDQENKIFDSNIGEDNYEMIESMLNTFNGWKNFSKSETTDYYSENMRLSICSEGTKKCIEKTRIKNFTYMTENLPLDIRISISIEKPIAVSKFPRAKSSLKNRQKSRISREYQKATFDTTKVISTDKGETVETFEIEVEHIGTLGSSIENSVFQIFYKILDCNYCCDGFIKTESSLLPIETFSAQEITSK